MLLSTICTLKMCNIFHLQIQSERETLLSHLSRPMLQKWVEGDKKTNKKNKQQTSLQTTPQQPSTEGSQRPP